MGVVDKRMNEIIENLPYAYARHKTVIDENKIAVDYIFLEVNAAFEEMTGLKRKEIVGKKITEVLAGIGKSDPGWIKLYGEIALSGEKRTFEKFSKFLSRWYEVTAYSDEKFYFTTIFRDVTEKKEIRDSYLKQNEKMEILLDLGKYMAEEKDPKSLSQLIVDSVLKILELQTSAIYLFEKDTLKLEAVNPPIAPGFPEKFRIADPNDHPHIQRAASENKIVIIEDSLKEELTDAENQICKMRNMRSHIYVPLSYNKNVLGVLIVSSVGDVYKFTKNDIEIIKAFAGYASLSISQAILCRDREKYIKEIENKNKRLKQNEKSISNMKKRIEDIFYYAEDVSFVTTDSRPQPRILDFSHGAEKIFGYKREEVINKKVSILHLSKDSKHFPEMVETLKNKQKGFSGEITLVRKNGERFPAMLNTHPLYDEEDNFWGTFGVSMDISELKSAENGLFDTIEKYRESLEGIIISMGVIIHKRDNYTANHQIRTSKLAVAIAEKMGMDSDRIEGLKLAADIHDIGKITVPAEILTKPGEISELEMQMLKTHPAVGSEILENINFPWPLARIVKQHHERIDGSGYPEGLSGKDILLEARILCVADVVDAMASHRPYRAAHDINTALAEISDNMGVLYDSDVVRICLKLFMQDGFTF